MHSVLHPFVVVQYVRTGGAAAIAQGRVTVGDQEPDPDWQPL